MGRTGPRGASSVAAKEGGSIENNFPSRGSICHEVVRFMFPNPPTPFDRLQVHGLPETSKTGSGRRFWTVENRTTGILSGRQTWLETARRSIAVHCV